MSGITPLPLAPDWSQLPHAHTKQIFEMIQDDPKSLTAAELTCRSWKKDRDSWRKSELEKIVPQDGELNLSIYPNITDSDTRILFALLKKAEVRFSKWHKFVNCLSCNPKEETILVTSIDLTGCKKITERTLKAMEGFSITSLRLKHCKKISIKSLQALLSSRKMNYVELP